ncbi:MAG: 16S rRNA (guanine(966)-N(2))-methyltransferase RsmD [Acidobacteriota bacterium]
MLRVIAGKYKGRRLRAPSGLDVRPTSDQLRETLFNIISSRIEGSLFLDICAGSGAVGIEALSRGAESATFIEVGRRACFALEENLRSLGISDQAEIINRDAAAALKKLASTNRQFDLVFFDPPYASPLYSKVMAMLASLDLIAPDGIAVVEHRAKSAIEDCGELIAYRQVKQGESALTFFRRSDQSQSPDTGQ